MYEAVDSELNLESPSAVADLLATYQRWRRGEGEFEWGEDPAKNREPPFTPSELSAIENAAVGFLRRLAEGKGA